MLWNKPQRMVIQHADTLKQNRAGGRILQLIGVILSLVGFVSCLGAPFTTATVKDSFGIMVIGIITAVVGKGIEWVYKD